MNATEIAEMLKQHRLWLEGRGGAQANLRDANLGDANLRGANLGDAYLGGANLRDAYLGGAYLRGANLRDANLRDANLRDAYLGDANLRDAYLGGANLPLSMTIEEWCDAHDLATLPDGRRVAFKRLDADMTTGQGRLHIIKWKRRGYSEAPDWNPEQACGGGLHLSPTPTDTRRYASGDVCVPVAFELADAVHIGDKLKVRRLQVL